jgi:hypothetical protein
MPDFKSPQTPVNVQPAKILITSIFAGEKSYDIENLRKDALRIAIKLEKGELQPWDATNRLCSICKQVVKIHKSMNIVIADSESDSIIKTHSFLKKVRSAPSEMYDCSVDKYEKRGGQVHLAVYHGWGYPLIESSYVFSKPLQREE